MKSLKFSAYASKRLRQIQLKDSKLFKKVQKQLNLLQTNPNLKSLRLHKIKRKDNLNVWSISKDRGHRILYIENEFFYIFDIGTHDEVYKK